jgi:nicotinamidase-related amidase
VCSEPRSPGRSEPHSCHISLPKQVRGALWYRKTMVWQRTNNPEEGDPWLMPRSLSFKMTPEPAPLEGEALFDQLTMSGQESTPLSMVLRNRCVTSIAPVGIAIEIENEPTPRLATVLGTLVVAGEGVCRSDKQAGAVQPFVQPLRSAGDAAFSGMETFCQASKREG